MKKNHTKMLVALSLVTGFTASSFAQSYNEGDKLLNVGIGFGSTLSGAGFTSTLPPIGLSFEMGIKENISAGGFLGYSGATYELKSLGGNWKWNYSYLVVGARGSYHFANSDKLDPYVGLMAGYNVVSVTVEKPASWTSPDLTSASPGGLIIGGHLGARYYFTDKIGAFAELGYGIAYIQLGLVAKF